MADNEKYACGYKNSQTGEIVYYKDKDARSQLKDITNTQPTDLLLDNNNLLQLVNSKGSKVGNGVTISTGGGNISDTTISEKTTWSSAKVKQEINNINNSIDATYDEASEKIIITSNKVSYDASNKKIILS